MANLPRGCACAMAPRVVPAERFFGGDEQTKGVGVSEEDSTELDEKVTGVQIDL